MNFKNVRIWDGNSTREFLDSIGLKDRYKIIIFISFTKNHVKLFDKITLFLTKLKHNMFYF